MGDIPGSVFCPVCLSVVNFSIRYNFRAVRDRYFIYWHAHYPKVSKDALSNDTKVDDLVTITLGLCFRWACIVYHNGILFFICPLFG